MRRQPSTRPRRPSCRGLAMAGPTQSTGTSQSPQPISSHSHHTRRLAHNNSRRDLQRQRSTHRLTDPASYRPISLLRTSYKLFAKITHTSAIDDRLRDTYFGFRAARPTSQPIHIIRRNIERADKIHPQALLTALDRYSVPHTLASDRDGHFPHTSFWWYMGWSCMMWTQPSQQTGNFSRGCTVRTNHSMI